MEGRLLPVNAVIGLVRGDGINPALLGDYGYQLAGLEITVKASTGKVVADVVIGNSDTARMMPVEAKSGKNIEEDQARRYRLLDGKDLVRVSHIALNTTRSPELEVVYACLGGHVDYICQGLTVAGVEFPVLAIYDDKIELHNREYAEGALSKAFERPHYLKAPPARLLRWDHDTEDDEIVRDDVLAVLVKCQAQRVGEISISSLTEQANPYYSLFGGKAKGGLAKKVQKAARVLSQKFPNMYQFVPAPVNDQGAGLVRILRTPEDNDPRGRTLSYRALASRKRPRRSQVHPGQEDLLRLIEEVDDIGHTGDEEADGQEDERAGGGDG